MEQYLQITFQQIPAEQQEILIARLNEIGFTGFDESDKQLVAFIPLTSFSETSFNELITDQLPHTRQIIDPKNWNEEWEKSFSPVIVDDYCAIRASFHDPVTSAAHEIIITPKMSFGTGHHATTYLMIQLMRATDFTGKTALDFGTGTGVLSILAEKSGAAAITAIDNDSWSINNVKENILANDCHKITVIETSIPPAGKSYDVILANINKHVILQQMSAMEQHLNDNGILVVSGLLAGDRNEIEGKAVSVGLMAVNALLKNSWIALVLKRRPL